MRILALGMDSEVFNKYGTQIVLSFGVFACYFETDLEVRQAARDCLELTWFEHDLRSSVRWGFLILSRGDVAFARRKVSWAGLSMYIHCIRTSVIL